MDLMDLKEISRRRRVLLTGALVWLPIFAAISGGSHHRARVQPHRLCTAQPSQAVPPTQSAQPSRSAASAAEPCAPKPSIKSR
jgi:hypothetical protein